MKHRLAIVALALATPAAADVTSATSANFVIETTVTVDAPRAKVWDTLRAPQLWWNPEHTYSGKSANLYMDTQATGCFCEKLADKGSVEHGHIVYVQPGRMIRLTGGLGPLQAEAVTATLAFTLDSHGEDATKVTMSYVVGGFMRQGGETLAPLVDKVLGDQLARLKAAAEAPATAPAPAK